MKFIFGNWKMYLDNKEAKGLIDSLSGEKFDEDKVKLSVFPNMINFIEAVKVLEESPISVGAQNVAWTPQGAYTGAVSAHLFKQAGAKYALVGHSERRYIFGENDEDVRKKMEACLDEDIVPVLCIGETKEDLDNGKREYRLKKQLLKAFEGLNLGAKDVIVAYEPVWAISQGGKGESCTPEVANEVHEWIKKELKKYTDQDIPVIYGGSVDEENVVSYVKHDMIDGVLVGSASTRFEEFTKIIRLVESL